MFVWSQQVQKQSEKTGKKQDQNYHSMKAYNLGGSLSTKIKSPLSDLSSWNFQKLFPKKWIFLHNVHT